MPDAIQIEIDDKIVDVRVTGKLTKEFYEELAPIVEKKIEEDGKIRVLFQMHDFHGWTAGAMWEDLKFDLAHWKDIEKLAIVGESKWEKGMATFCKPFTKAKIQYFDHSRASDARAWIQAD